MLLHDLFLYAVLRLRHLVPETTISSKSRRSGVQHLPPNGAATSVQSLSLRWSRTHGFLIVAGLLGTMMTGNLRRLSSTIGTRKGFLLTFLDGKTMMYRFLACNTTLMTSGHCFYQCMRCFTGRVRWLSRFCSVKLGGIRENLGKPCSSSSLYNRSYWLTMSGTAGPLAKAGSRSRWRLCDWALHRVHFQLCVPTL